jgi:hypothetical protein
MAGGAHQRRDVARDFLVVPEHNFFPAWFIALIPFEVIFCYIVCCFFRICCCSSTEEGIVSILEVVLYVWQCYFVSNFWFLS